MNESVEAMITKLHARLDDLSEVVKEIPFELNGYDKKLDKIDDQVYLIEVELEKKLKNTVSIPSLSSEQADAFDKATGASSHSSSAQSNVHVVEKEESGESKVTITEDVNEKEQTSTNKESKQAKEGKEDKEEEEKEEKEEGFLTDSAKETIAGATKTLNSFYKDGKEVFGEFSEALGDIKEVFGKNNFFKKR